MPTYDYVCRQCGCKFEEFQAITAKPLKKCPECGAPALQRLIGTGAGILFKGSGFYQTDYRSESYKRAAQAEKTGTSAGSSTTVTADKTSTGAKTPGADKSAAPEPASATPAPMTPAKEAARRSTSKAARRKAV
jgi:putative FmdB family regulatory protein